MSWFRVLLGKFQVKDKTIVIIGAGQVAAELSLHLSNHGHMVVVADSEEDLDSDVMKMIACDNGPDLSSITKEILAREDYSPYAKKPSKSKNKSERKELRGWK